nr:lytic murein transglycosylase [Micromonospora sp. RTGN7]
MVDGEDTSTVRPLRPATPPEDPGGLPARAGLPRPRRPWLRSTKPADTPARPADASDVPADVDGPSTSARADVGPTNGPTHGPTAAADSTAVRTDSTAPVETAPIETAPVEKADLTDTIEKVATAGTAEKSDAVEKIDAAAPADSAEKADGVVAGGIGRAGATRRRRVPFAHAVRMPPPRQAAVAVARATRAWSRRPSGRLTLPGLLLLGLVGATAAAGALLVPATAQKSRPTAVDATAATPQDSTGATQGGMIPGVPGTPLPPGATVPPGATTVPGGPVMAGRPADALAAWAQQTGVKAHIAPVAMQAYGYAELVLSQTMPGCRLSWTTLAAIGHVESGHGQANGATLGPDGRALPEIIGDPLDGNGGRSKIMDTDRGLYDRDTVYDRAIGPMQFIPTTWQEIGADADSDGRRDPHDLDDAALAAGNYLCKGGRNLTVPGDWWGAILSYNDVRRYAQNVFDKANEYGLASRT